MAQHPDRRSDDPPWWERYALLITLIAILLAFYVGGHALRNFCWYGCTLPDPTVPSRGLVVPNSSLDPRVLSAPTLGVHRPS